MLLASSVSYILAYGMLPRVMTTGSQHLTRFSWISKMFLTYLKMNTPRDDPYWNFVFQINSGNQDFENKPYKIWYLVISLFLQSTLSLWSCWHLEDDSAEGILGSAY